MENTVNTINATGSNLDVIGIACPKGDDAMLSAENNATDPVLFTEAEWSFFRNILATGIANKIVESVVKRTDLAVDKSESKRYPPSTIKKEV